MRQSKYISVLHRIDDLESSEKDGKERAFVLHRIDDLEIKPYQVLTVS